MSIGYAMIPALLAATLAGGGAGPTTTTAAAAQAGRPPALEAYRWQLRGAVDAQGQQISALLVDTNIPVQLEFTAGRLIIRHACNQLSGHYRLRNGLLEVSKLMSTRMACADSRKAGLDQAVSKRLQGSLALELYAPASNGSEQARLALILGGNSARAQLALTTSDGSVLSFTGQPTPATRYGPGKRVYLEVAGDTAPCTAPCSDGVQQCLQVRRVNYNEATGRRVGIPGAFKLFNAPIGDYKHTPGMREVLRVDRYSLTNPPANIPAQTYVLDMVIESQAERP